MDSYASAVISGKPTEVHLEPQEEAHWLGQDDGGGATVDQVDHQEGEGGQGRQEELVAPAEVQDVVRKPKEHHAADGEEGTQEVGKLGGGAVVSSGYWQTPGTPCSRWRGGHTGSGQTGGRGSG